MQQHTSGHIAKKTSKDLLLFTKWLFLHIHVAIVVPILCLAGCAVQPVADPRLTLDTSNDVQTLRQVLHHGDWLVSRGVHITDNMVASLTNMPLSHAAIFDAEKDMVIEADSSGIHTTPLQNFMTSSQRIMVIRPLWSSPEQSAQAVQRARSWIGKSYNFTGLIGINSPDRYYCTQVALLAYKPFMPNKLDNPIPPVIKPGQLYHWGRIIYDTGPITGAPESLE